MTFVQLNERSTVGFLNKSSAGILLLLLLLLLLLKS